MPTIPFSSEAGSINVGCDEWGTTSVKYTAPDGAVISEYHANWKDLSNIKVSNVDVTASPDGKTVTATGKIRGLDVTWPLGIRNCPGGGHGKLVISGSYTLP
jgi:hypothetical protein